MLSTVRVVKYKLWPLVMWLDCKSVTLISAILKERKLFVYLKGPVARQWYKKLMPFASIIWLPFLISSTWVAKNAHLWE